MLQGQVGVHPLHTLQLVLHILQVAQLRDFHAGVLAFPDVVRRIADTVLAACLGDLRSDFNFFEDADDLFFAELRLFHAELL